MPPLPIVKHLNVIEYGLFGFSPCFEVTQVDKLIFQGAEIALRTSVVITIPFAAHAGNKAVFAKQSLIGMTGELNTTIRMMEQSFGRVLPANRLLQSLDDKLFGLGVVHGKSHNIFAAKVYNTCQIEPFIGRNITDMLTHTVFGAEAWKFWFRRFFATGRLCLEFVVA